MKTNCRTCGDLLTDANWWVYFRKTYQYQCKLCHTKQSYEYRQKNKDTYRSYQNAWQRANRAKCNLKTRLYNKNLRLKIIEGLGGKCECCGESRYEFMSFDHRLGGGSKERRKDKNHQSNFYRRIRDSFFDRKLYRLLCHNCNSAYGYYKYCPHKGETVL